MSLIKAVTMISGSMKEKATTIPDIEVRMTLLSFAAQLDAVCIACGDSQDHDAAIAKAIARQFLDEMKPNQGLVIPGAMLTPEMQHRQMIDAEREKIRQKKASTEIHEKIGDGGANMMEVIGGPAGDGEAISWIDVGPEMPPEGAFTRISGGKYQVRNGKLQHIPE